MGRSARFEHGGIYDLVASDQGELGRAALAALDAIDLRVVMGAKAFSRLVDSVKGVVSPGYAVQAGCSRS
jgi:hypothetical protein